MPYVHYARAAREHVYELQSSLSSEDAQFLAEMLDTITPGQWSDWMSASFAEIQRYIAATPSERKKKKKWQKRGERLFLVYAAYIEATQACTLLCAITDNYMPLGASYRDMTAVAAKAHHSALRNGFPRWPFDCRPPRWMGS